MRKMGGFTVRIFSKQCTVAYNCLERAFAFIFSHYGRFVSRFPFLFLALPLIIAFTATAGIYKLEMYSNAEYLFTPDDGRAKSDREAISRFNLLPISSWMQPNDFCKRMNIDFNNSETASGSQTIRTGNDVERQTTKCRFAHALIIARPGVNLFDPTVLFRILELDRQITEFKVANSAGKLVDNYDSLCERSTTTFECLSAAMTKTVNPVGLLFGGTYPYFSNIFIGPYLGGVKTEEKTNRIISVEAAQLYYCIGSGDPVSNSNWESSFLKFLNNLNDPYYEVYPYSATVLETEIKAVTIRLLLKFAVALGALILFSMVLCLATDSVRSKPWLGLLGILSTGLATAAAFGICGWTGTPFITLSVVMPFLTLGIGIDDMFVLMNSWSRTNPTLPVETRLSLTMKDAGTSIAITSFINVLSFIIGSYMPYPGIQIFSKATTAAMFFDFFLQMTFFTACLALFGHVEAANRHSFICCSHVETRKSAIYNKRSTFFAVICAGGGKTEDLDSHDDNEGKVQEDVPSKVNEAPAKGYEMKSESEDHKNSKAYQFFHDKYAPALLSVPGRTIVVVFFIAYIAFSFWGSAQIHEGLRMEHLAPDNSTSVRYFYNLRRYFRHYAQSVSFVFMLNQDLDYSDRIVQRDSLELFTKLESSGDLFWGGDSTEFWLRDYLPYLSNVTNDDVVIDSALFVSILRCNFLRHSHYRKYEDDLRFDKTGSRIIASRGVVLSRDIVDSNREREMMVRAREVADSYPHLGVFAYNQEFVFYDQYVTVLPLTIYNILIAVASVIIASMLMIVHPVCIFWLFLTILSIVVGIFGLMSFWDVDLDSISMVCIIICVGYCVDYATHFMHAYVTSESMSRREKTIEAICDLGLTVAQAGCATTLSILALATNETYIFRTFFKTLFICIGLSSIHAMVILPVFLAMFGPLSTRPDLEAKKRLKDSSTENNQTDENGNVDIRNFRKMYNNVTSPDVSNNPVSNSLPSSSPGMTTVSSSNDQHQEEGAIYNHQLDVNNIGVFESAAHMEFRRATGLFSSSSSQLVLLVPAAASNNNFSSPSTESSAFFPSNHNVTFSSSSSSSALPPPVVNSSARSGSKWRKN